MLTAIEDRLEAQVPDLAGKVKTAADFAELLKSNRAPSWPVAAFVVPNGISGRPADVASGYFSQPIVRGVSVSLWLKATDPRAHHAIGRVGALLDEIVAALCGWAPGDEPGVFELARATVVPSDKGLLLYQIDFTIQDELRITP